MFSERCTSCNGSRGIAMSDESGFLQRTVRKLFPGFTQNFVYRCFYEINKEISTSNSEENEFLLTQKTRQQRRQGLLWCSDILYYFSSLKPLDHCLNRTVLHACYVRTFKKFNDIIGGIGLSFNRI